MVAFALPYSVKKIRETHVNMNQQMTHDAVGQVRI